MKKALLLLIVCATAIQFEIASTTDNSPRTLRIIERRKQRITPKKTKVPTKVSKGGGKKKHGAADTAAGTGSKSKKGKSMSSAAGGSREEDDDTVQTRPRSGQYQSDTTRARSYGDRLVDPKHPSRPFTFAEMRRRFDADMKSFMEDEGRIYEDIFYSIEQAKGEAIEEATDEDSEDMAREVRHSSKKGGGGRKTKKGGGGRGKRYLRGSGSGASSSSSSGK